MKIVEHPDVIHREYGAAVDLQCTATGDPPPLISWMKGGRPVSTFPNCYSDIFALIKVITVVPVHD